MILNDLFSTLDDFRDYVPGIESNVTFKELNSSSINAKKRICNLISSTVYDSIVSDPENNTNQLDALRMAMANLTAKQQLVFDAIRNRKSRIEVYKYELEAMTRNYADNYFNAMDTLLQLLVSTDDESFKSTNMYKLISVLPIKTASDFDMLYPIDCSYLFFFRSLSIQRDAYNTYLNTAYNKINNLTTLSEDEKKSYNDRLNTILAKWTVSLALLRFDILEFPAVIRDYFSDSKKPTDQNGTETLSNSLLSECQKDLDIINMQLTDTSTLSVDTHTSYTLPTDKIILMP